MVTPPSPPSGPDPGGDRWGARRAMEVLALAFVFPATIVVGYLVGGWLGERMGAPTGGAIGGAALGAAAGFWQLYVFLRRLRA